MTRNNQADIVAMTTAELIVHGAGVRRYLTNVKLDHQGVLLFCDQAVHQAGTATLSGSGHVLLVQGDSVTVQSDSMQYNAATRQATLLGRVVFQDRHTLLTTTQLDYSIPSGIFCYTGQSRFTDDQRTLVSAGGCYDTRTKKPADPPTPPVTATAQTDSLWSPPVPLRATTRASKQPNQPVSELKAEKVNNPASQSVVQINAVSTPSGQLAADAPRKTAGMASLPSAGVTARLPQPSAKPRRTPSSPSQVATPSANESDLERLLNSRPRPSNIPNFY